jgi:hypothetical protein
MATKAQDPVVLAASASSSPSAITRSVACNEDCKLSNFSRLERFSHDSIAFTKS